MGDLGQHFAVALITVRFVVYIACFLYNHLASTRVITQMRKSRTPERKIAGENILVITDLLAHSLFLHPVAESMPARRHG